MWFFQIYPTLVFLSFKLNVVRSYLFNNASRWSLKKKMNLFIYVLLLLITFLVLQHIIYKDAVIGTIKFYLDKSLDPVDIENQIRNSYRATKVISIKNVSFSKGYEKVYIKSKGAAMVDRIYQVDSSTKNLHVFNASYIRGIKIDSYRDYRDVYIHVSFYKHPDVKFE